MFPMANAKSILVVEDDADVLRTVTDILVSDGYRVTGVTGGLEAMRRLEEERFDAILTDMRLGDYHGAVLTRMVRQLWPETPVALMTAYEKDPMVSVTLMGGVRSLVIKPFRPEELLRTVRELFREPAHA
jgi:DNA-binding response OmpR family regulator